jgi:hypothetical protein
MPSEPSIRAVVSCDQERKLQRLLLVQPWIAERCVVQTQVFVYQTFTPSSALRHGITRELKMHATKEGVVLLVNLEC